MQATIYHNPNCSNSRKALEIIRAHGIEPHIVEYLKTPLTPQQLPVYAQMQLASADDDTLLAAVAAHPILLNRPIVVTPKGAKLCRPGEVVGSLL